MVLFNEKCMKTSNVNCMKKKKKKIVKGRRSNVENNCFVCTDKAHILVGKHECMQAGRQAGI